MVGPAGIARISRSGPGAFHSFQPGCAQTVALTRLEAGPALTSNGGRTRMANAFAPAGTDLLVVDDEPDLRALLAEYFGRHGFAVRCAADAAAARREVAAAVPAMVVLDVHMPGENGLSFARWLREAHPRIGLVMLTTASDSVDRIVGLEVGADDYVPKPFELRELLARMRAVLRRLLAAPDAATAAAAVTVAAPEVDRLAQVTATAGASTADAPGRPHLAVPIGSTRAEMRPPTRRVRFGACALDLDERRLVGADGHDIDISAAEFDLLALFARHPNRPLNRDQIMEQAHHRGWDVFDRSIDLRVMRLRRKIEKNPDKPELIKTVRNVGYVFVPGNAGNAARLAL